MKKLFTMMLLMATTVIFAQGTIKGTITDPDTGTPLPGANVMVAGTSNGTTTDFDGNFTIELSEANLEGEIVITYVGFSQSRIPYNIQDGEILELGELSLELDENALGEIVVTSYSLAIDRKTPVAVSAIKAEQIKTKLGSQEFPEILKSTPGVYVTRQGGGFGDADLRIRGFQSDNVAVLINGVPINDMENGAVYWSNWAGLADVTKTMQVQRGLGASKVAVPSVGGTVNIVTQTTDAEEGGNVFTTLGNDNYFKYGATYSTGLMDNGFAASVSAARTTGDGYVDGTEFKAVSYFINMAKRFNDKHELSFTAFGAKQRHGQRQNRHLISDYRESERGIRYNSDWGFKNGQVVNIEDNFYHKPQISLNHYWNISEKSFLSTAVYASFGTGGGGGTRGENKFSNEEYTLGPLGPVDVDRIVDENIENGAGGSESILRASRNDHNWYGVLSTFSTDLSEELELLVGLDLRDYTGKHFYEVTDLLGGEYFADDSDENNPNRALQVGDKFNYYNDGKVRWAGVFTQLEYSKNDLAAFVSLAGSNTSYKRVDYFQYLDSDPLQETDWFSFAGYVVKGGANYNLNKNHNIFANLGYFEKAPEFDAVFPNFNNEEINDDAENQKILSFELGYGFRSSRFRANINAYRTTWRDRTETRSFQLSEDETGFANILGVNAIHQGIEIDLLYRLTDKLRLTGMASIGDYRWEKDIKGVEIRAEDQTLVSTVDLFIEDVPVGDAAQTTVALGLSYDLLEKTTFNIDYNYFDRYYADFDPSDGGYPEGEGLATEPWQIPDYGIFDASIKHGFQFGGFDATLYGRMNNVFNTEYISDALDGTDSNMQTALVWYGVGRTFTVGAKLNF
jgi:outer membrane cobalamin receptor